MLTAHSTFITGNAAQAKSPFISFEIDGYSRIFTNRTDGIGGHYAWIAEGGVSDITFDVTPLEGTSDLSDVTVTIVDYQGLLTADMPAITLEGRTCRIKTWFPGMTYANALTLFTGKIDTIPSSNTNTSYDFVCKDTRIDLKQVVYLTGDDGEPTDSSHKKTVVANPIDILESILLTYLGISSGDVDVAKLDAYKAGPFAGVQFEFDIDSPPEAKAFIESQIMKPLGGYLRSSNVGKLTPHFFLPLPGTIASVMSLTNMNLVDVPQVQQADLVNVVSVRFDKEDNRFTSEAVNQLATSVTKYGQQGQDVIESDGMRSAFQGYFLSNLTSQAIFNRYGDKNPKFDCEALWTAVVCEPGDLVDVTHALMPDRKAGTMGVTAALFEIESMTLNMSKFTVTLSLVDAGFLKSFGAYRIAPDSKADWTSATTPDKVRYMYVAGADGKYSDATDGHTLA